MKKRSESSMGNLETIPLSKIISNTRFRTPTKNEKSLLQTKNIKGTSSTFNMNEKNVKKDAIISKLTTKQETGSVSKRNEISDKQINRTLKSEKYSNKINNVNMKSTTKESKLKSIKTQTASKVSISKNTVGNIQSSPVVTQNLHSKTQSKVKNKPKKKVIATKSEIFNTDKTLSESPFTVGNDNFDLTDIIEASLKNIRSPRSIFDYDFSCVEQSRKTRDILDIKNEIQNIDKLKELKPTRSSVTNNFFNKIIQGDRILEKLSEKSEPFSEESNESLVHNKKLLPGGDNKFFSLSEKYMKAREELRKSLDWKQGDLISSHDLEDPCLDIGFQNKSFINSKKVDNNREKSFIRKTSSKTSFLESYSLNNSESKKEKNSKISKEKLNKIFEDHRK